jgi:hypothetical protein
MQCKSPTFQNMQYLDFCLIFQLTSSGPVLYAIIFKTNTFALNNVGIFSNIYNIEFSL